MFAGLPRNSFGTNSASPISPLITCVRKLCSVSCVTVNKGLASILAIKSRLRVELALSAIPITIGSSSPLLKKPKANIINKGKINEKIIA